MDRRRSVTFRVQPRASRTEIVGLYGDAVKIRVKAPPAEGAANEELMRFLAKRLEVPRSSVRIVAGKTRRHKQVVIDGMTAQESERILLENQS